MAFCAIFVPQFPLQSVFRSEPSLCAQPLVLLDGVAPLFRVVAVSEAARSLGVTLGMTKAAAAEFHGVQMRPRDPEQEAAAHAALLDAAWSVTPRVENTALDTVVLDLAGMKTLFGRYEEIARQVQSCCAEIGLDVQVAISENVETARILACAQSGPTIVPAGQEARFLEPLDVELLTLSEDFAEVLRRWGITRCGALAALPVLSLSECVGQEGVRLHAIASGKGNRTLILSEPTRTFEELLELDDAIEELEPLSFLLGRLLDQLCARVAARALAVRTIRLQFELQPSFDEAFDASRQVLRSKQPPGRFHCSMTLPRPTQDPKLLLKLLRLRLQGKPPNAAVQKLWMYADPDCALAIQGKLFRPATPDPEKLELTLARIANVVGENNVGSAEILDSYRPDTFRMQKFSPLPFLENREKDAANLWEGLANAKISFRYFRPPLPAYVELDEYCPVKVSWKGNTGKVVRASGPWRLSGQWWEENPWNEDAWEVELGFSGKSELSGVYCIVFNALQKRWFVRGSYD
jgi:protein ImuB